MGTVKKIFVVRHAESLEDADPNAYEFINDEHMPLTNRGKQQAVALGKDFAHEMGVCKKLHVFLSPSRRVLETAQLVVSELPKKVKWSLVTDELLRKQNCGDMTIHNRRNIENERYRTGVLRYQYPGGESAAEFLSRFDLFVQNFTQELQGDASETFLVITHGFAFRVLLKAMFGWTEEYFESLAHPHHCEMKRVAYNKNTFVLLDKMRVYDSSQNANFVRRI